jgi:hypothetical protein
MNTTIALITLSASLFLSTGSHAQKRASSTRQSAAAAHSYRASNYSSTAALSLGGEIMLNKTVYGYNGQGYGSFSPGFFAVANVGVGPEVGFTFKLGYDNKQAGMSATGFDANASIDYLDLVAMARYSVTPEFFFACGPVLNFSMGNAKLTVLANGATQTATKDPAVGTRFGFSLETGYAIPVARNVSIVPIAGYDYFFTGATEDGEGRLNNLHLAARVQFGMN